MFYPSGIVFVLWALTLSSLVIVGGFLLESLYHRNDPMTWLLPRNDRILLSESRARVETLHRRFFGSDAHTTTTTTSTTATSTCLKMVENKNDPDILLQMVEELSMEEFTPETMAKMEKVEIALAKFLEEKSALLQQQQEQLGLYEEPPKPPPPPIPPPGSLLENTENQEPRWQQQPQNRDLANDLARTGAALEVLQQRLRLEEEALLEAELAFQQDSFEETTQESNFNAQDVLQQAEEALRRSRMAAEKRKLEAERRAVTAARVSAGYRRQQLQEQAYEQQHQQQEEQQLQEQAYEQQQHLQEEQQLNQEQAGTETFGGADPYGDENVHQTQNIPGDENENLPRTKRRPTIVLSNLFGKRGAEELWGEMSGSSNDGMDATSLQEIDTRVPEGVPILYNWVQDEDGSITGNIQGSMYYRDGAKISTSCASERAQGGITIATESGSRYFLEERTATTENFEEGFFQSELGVATGDGFVTPKAPDGVPTVKSWEVIDGGIIIGLIYGSPYADDGDYIETSPIVEGEIDNYSVVSTLSGSRYFLSGDPPEDPLDTLDVFKDERIPNRSRQTFSLSKVSPPQQPPRSTFSLFDLFDGGRDNSNSNNSNRQTYLRDGPPRPLPPPTPDKVPPQGTPSLTGCVFNADGTITGYVFGSSKISDGVLITTSPIVRGNREQFETVITASGSAYFLG